MKPYPFEASNHLMTPAISTRLAAASPSPDNASKAASRSALAEYSTGPSLFCSVPPDGGPPSFLDSNQSDPMTPDPTLETIRFATAAAEPEHAPLHNPS